MFVEYRVNRLPASEPTMNPQTSTSEGLGMFGLIRRCLARLGCSISGTTKMSQTALSAGLYGSLPFRFGQTAISIWAEASRSQRQVCCTSRAKGPEKRRGAGLSRRVSGELSCTTTTSTADSGRDATDSSSVQTLGPFTLTREYWTAIKMALTIMSICAKEKVVGQAAVLSTAMRANVRTRVERILSADAPRLSTGSV